MENCNCEIRECECENVYFGIIGRQFVCRDVFRVQGDNFRYDSQKFLQKCDIVNNTIALPIASLFSICIYINIENQVYIVLPVNQKELE